MTELVGKSLTKVTATPYSRKELEGLAELLDRNIRTGHDIVSCFNGNSLSRLIAQSYRDIDDAARFRALMRCGRIKMQGSSGVDPTTGDRNGSNVHFGAEFWPEPLPQDYRDKYPDETANYDRNTAWGRAAIRALADAVLEQEASRRASIG